MSNLQLENAVARDGNGSAIMVFGGDGSSASGDFCTFVNNSNLAAAASSAASNAASLATTLAGGSGIPVGGYGYGGAVYGGEHTLIGFDNSYFSNNIASNGGAIGCYGCQLAVGKCSQGCTICARCHPQYTRQNRRKFLCFFG